MDEELQEGSARSEAKSGRRSSADLRRHLRLNLEYQRSSNALEKELIALIHADQKIGAARFLPNASMPALDIHDIVAAASVQRQFSDLERAGLRDSLAELGRQIEVEERGVCRPDSAMEMRPRNPTAEARAAKETARARRLILGPIIGGTEAALLAASGGDQELADQAASLALDVLLGRGLGDRADISTKPADFGPGIAFYESNAAALFPKVSNAETQKTLVTSRR